MDFITNFARIRRANRKKINRISKLADSACYLANVNNSEIHRKKHTGRWHMMDVYKASWWKNTYRERDIVYHYADVKPFNHNS